MHEDRFNSRQLRRSFGSFRRLQLAFLLTQCQHILERIGIVDKAFVKQMGRSGLGFIVALGCTQSSRAFAGSIGQHFIRDGGLSTWLFENPTTE